MPSAINSKEKLLKALEANTVKDGGGCWLWQGSPDSNGYGIINFMYQQTRVHRASAHLFLGLDLTDKKVQVNHKLACTHNNCWNPEHLYIGTKSDNRLDEIIAEGKNCCPKGHPYDMINSRGKRDCRTCRREASRRHYDKVSLL